MAIEILAIIGGISLFTLAFIGIVYITQCIFEHNCDEEECECQK